jgi:hypothetical protein
MPQFSKSILTLLLTATGASLLRSSLAAEPSISVEAIVPAAGPIVLFDGKTLGDCYAWLQATQREAPKQVFRVDDGLLHVTGDGLGSLITNKAYRDYHLVLEYRWGGTKHGRIARMQRAIRVCSSIAMAPTAATRESGSRRSKCRSLKEASAILSSSPAMTTPASQFPSR